MWLYYRISRSDMSILTNLNGINISKAVNLIKYFLSIFPPLTLDNETCEEMACVC